VPTVFEKRNLVIYDEGNNWVIVFSSVPKLI